jgi:hypothetical protein
MRKAFVIPVSALGLGLFLALGLCGLTMPKAASAQVAVGISVRVGPPALPVYAQPICPGPDYIWTPGYWSWDPDAQQYYWVPGTWVLAPEPGYLWTPGWWGFAGGLYLWHPGYWGPHVGFYGGVNYGFGYFGNGYAGGEWRGGHFFYNTAVSRVNVNVVRNVYVNRTVVRNEYVNNHVSYNGGPHGINARPTAQEQRWDSERHVEATSVQRQHVDQARGNQSLRYNQNHGRPPIAATPRPTQFPGNNGNRNEFRPPQNQNREVQPNNPRPENRTFTPPNNQRPENRNYQPNYRPQQNNARPENRNYNAPNNRPQPNNVRPENRGNAPKVQPHNEQHGNQGGDRGHDNKDDGHR